MASQGPNSPGTVSSNAVGGTEPWASPGNASASDNTYTTANCNTGFEISEYLWSTNYSFSIPSGATINGIVVEVDKKASINSGPCRLVDVDARIIQGGSAIGNNNKSLANWPTTEATITYGSSSDLWGLTWADTDINASNFGFALQCRNLCSKSAILASVDHIRITVHYTGGAAPTNPLLFVTD